MSTNTGNAPQQKEAPDYMPGLCMKMIAGLRLKIDGIDYKIAGLLARRFEQVKKIAEIKREADLPVCDPAREVSQFQRFVSLAGTYHVPPEQFILPFMTIIHLSKRAQQSSHRVADTKPLVPKLCLACGWRTCGIEVPESAVRVCPTCHSPLF